jgi:hypothetical protein
MYTNGQFKTRQFAKGELEAIPAMNVRKGDVLSGHKDFPDIPGVFFLDSMGEHMWVRVTDVNRESDGGTQISYHQVDDQSESGVVVAKPGAKVIRFGGEC